MPASAANDKVCKATPNFSTTLNGGIGSSDTTIALNSTTGLPTDTAVIITIDATDANGTATPSKKEVIRGEVSGSNLVNCVRGVEGTQQAHSNSAVVVDYTTAQHWNRLASHILTDHNQDGTHKPTTIYDANGNESFEFGATAAATTNVKATNAATGTNPRLSASGESNRGVDIYDSNGNEILKTTGTASAVNELTLANAATGNAPTFTASGNDTNININLTPKGSGSVVVPKLTSSSSDLTTSTLKGVINQTAAKSTTYSITATDTNITGDCTSGAFTVTLPTAVGVTGQTYTVTKVDSSANALTIGTTSSQTIAGQTTYKIYNQYQSVTVYSDGSNWQVANIFPGLYQSWTPSAYNNITVGNGTVTAKFRKVGTQVDYIFRFTLGTTSAVGNNADFALPVAVSSDYGTVDPIGNIYSTSGAGIFLGLAVTNATANRAQLIFGVATGSFVSASGTSASVPGVWASGSNIQVTGSYECASVAS